MVFEVSLDYCFMAKQISATVGKADRAHLFMCISEELARYMEQVRNVKNEDEYDVSLFCMENDCKLLYKHTFVIINAIQTASKSIQAS